MVKQFTKTKTEIMSVTPRIYHPGILPLGGRKVTDKGEVEKAMEDLRQLKRDPYYYEAMLRLSRRGQLVDNRPGPLPRKVGELAGKLQRPQTTRSPGKRGHPLHKELDGLRVMAERIAEWRTQGKLKIPLIELCRRMVNLDYPNSSSEQRKQLAGAVERILRELLRPKRSK